MPYWGLSQTVRIIDQLAAVGYVERARDPADRRRFTLTATAAHRRWPKWCKEIG
ncbi:winged helix DNA-binding protein [Streptomyces niveus]|uniref:winged helix DNA-binding protein n=1 Tax=Streptomyces niveus TaxID=193462 RepID=UPI003418B008